MAGPESKVSTWFANQIKKQYGKRAIYIKPPQGMYTSRKGISDFILCIDGCFIAVEMKAEAGMGPTLIQQDYLDTVTEAGGLGLCCAGKDVTIFDKISKWIQKH
jgi:hypothetical protein